MREAGGAPASNGCCAIALVQNVMTERAAVALAFAMDRYLFDDLDDGGLVAGLDDDVVHDVFAAWHNGRGLRS